MAGIKKRGPLSVNNKRYYNGEVVKPVRYYSEAEGVKGRMCGADINGDIIRDEYGKPKPYKSI
tara:strand:- start:829 stop:1017 length:189 start_codon:yes stop_codon:yes gene_type:complete